MFGIKHRDFWTEEFGLGIEAMDIEPHFKACPDFTDAGFEAGVRGDVSGVECVCLDASGVGNVDGTFILKPLGDKNDPVEAENFPSAHHGIEGSETGIIAVDAVVGHTVCDESLAHFFRFVVKMGLIVA